MDRAARRSSTKSAVEKFEIRRIQELESKQDLRKSGIPPTSNLSARSATGCVVHGSGFLPTTSPTRDDETRRVDGSVLDRNITCALLHMQRCSRGGTGGGECRSPKYFSGGECCSP